MNQNKLTKENFIDELERARQTYLMHNRSLPKKILMSTDIYYLFCDAIKSLGELPELGRSIDVYLDAKVYLVPDPNVLMLL